MEQNIAGGGSKLLTILPIVFLVVSLFATAVTVNDPLKKQLLGAFAKLDQGTGGTINDTVEPKPKEKPPKDKPATEPKTKESLAEQRLGRAEQVFKKQITPTTKKPPVTTTSALEKTDDGFIRHTTTITRDPVTNNVVDAKTVSTTSKETSVLEKTDDGFIRTTTTITRDVDTGEIVDAVDVRTTNKTSSEFVTNPDGSTTRRDTTKIIDLDTGETKTYTSQTQISQPKTTQAGQNQSGPIDSLIESLGGNPNAMSELYGGTGYTPGLAGNTAIPIPESALTSPEGFKNWAVPTATMGVAGPVLLGGAIGASTVLTAAAAAGVPVTTYLYAQAQATMQTYPAIPTTLNTINIISKANSVLQCASGGSCDPMSILPSSLGSGLPGTYNILRNPTQYSLTPSNVYGTYRGTINLPSNIANLNNATIRNAQNLVTAGQTIPNYVQQAANQTTTYAFRQVVIPSNIRYPGFGPPGTYNPYSQMSLFPTFP